MSTQPLAFISKLRRPRFGTDKQFKCDQPGCKSSFYHARNLYTHEVNKHGRVRRSLKEPEATPLSMIGPDSGDITFDYQDVNPTMKSSSDMSPLDYQDVATISKPDLDTDQFDYQNVVPITEPSSAVSRMEAEEPGLTAASASPPVL